jgi:hypothetical protein
MNTIKALYQDAPSADLNKRLQGQKDNLPGRTFAERYSVKATTVNYIRDCSLWQA